MQALNPWSYLIKSWSLAMKEMGVLLFSLMIFITLSFATIQPEGGANLVGTQRARLNRVWWNQRPGFRCGIETPFTWCKCYPFGHKVRGGDWLFSNVQNFKCIARTLYAKGGLYRSYFPWSSSSGHCLRFWACTCPWYYIQSRSRAEALTRY